MKKRYDATMRKLFDPEPAAWLEFFGVPVPDPGLVQVIDSNVSTVTAETDKLLRLGGPDPFILHIEFLSGRDTGYPGQAFWYNTLASHKHQVPVWSVLVLLRPAADGPELTGEYEQQFPGRGRNLWFRYDVIRVWHVPPERLLKAGLPLLPLAPVSNVAPEQLTAVLRAVAERLRDEADRELKTTLVGGHGDPAGAASSRSTREGADRGRSRPWSWASAGSRNRPSIRTSSPRARPRAEAKGEAKGEAREGEDDLAQPGPEEAGPTRRTGPRQDRGRRRSRSAQRPDSLHPGCNHLG